MRQIRQVLRLAHETNWSQRAIARSLGLSRDAVGSYLTRSAAVGLPWPIPEDIDDQALERLLFPSDAQPFVRKPHPAWAEVHREMQIKGATLAQLHQEYLVDHPDGMQYSQYCQLYKRWCKSLKSYLRQPHVAGERVFVDYAGPTMQVHDRTTGEVRKVQVFVGVLGASSLTYAEAHWSQQLPDWIAAHVRMFNFFGAAPQVIVCDNLKSAVSKASRVDPVLNSTYQNLASHYKVTIIAARPHSPKDKAKVENGVLIVERWIVFVLRKQVFYSLHELNEAIHALMVKLNDKPFQKLPGSRRSTFESVDLPALQALPSTDFEYAEFRKVRVGMDGSVLVDGRPYSVPRDLVRQEVELRLTAGTVEVLYKGRRVTSHVRGPGAEPAVHPEHLSDAQRYFKEWSADNELAWAATVGPHVEGFMRAQLVELKFKEQGYRLSMGLKKMEREVGTQRLDAACRKALEIGASSMQSVRSILKTRLEQVSQGEHEEADFDHSNVRGGQYYH